MGHRARRGRRAALAARDERRRRAWRAAPVGRRAGLRTALVVALASGRARGRGAGVMWLLRPLPASGVPGAPEPRPAPGRGTERRRTCRQTTTRRAGRARRWRGRRTDSARLRRPPGRRAAALRAAARRRRGAPAPEHRGRAGAGGLGRRPVGGVLGGTGRSGKCRFGGGPVMDLASAVTSLPMGLAWSDDGRLFFGRDDGRIWAIPTRRDAGGGDDARRGRSSATSCPGRCQAGRRSSTPCGSASWSWGDEEVVAQNLATGERKVLLKDAADARYVPSGHLVFLRRGRCSPCRSMPSGWRFAARARGGARRGRAGADWNRRSTMT